MKPKHTPGPWSIEEPNGHGMGWKVGPAWLGRNTLGNARVVGEADARLVSAAPDLLEAAAMLVALDFGDDSAWDGDMERAATMLRAAVKKAIGGKS